MESSPRLKNDRDYFSSIMANTNTNEQSKQLSPIHRLQLRSNPYTTGFGDLTYHDDDLVDQIWADNNKMQYPTRLTSPKILLG